MGADHEAEAILVPYPVFQELVRELEARRALADAKASVLMELPGDFPAEFDLEAESREAIVKRLRKSWIQFKATQPFSFQSAARIFKNPPGLNAAVLIEQTGLIGTKVGAALVSDRNPNYLVVEPGAAARDALQLIATTCLPWPQWRQRYSIEPICSGSPHLSILSTRLS